MFNDNNYNLSSFIKMIEKTNYIECNKIFYNNLDEATKNKTINIIINEWNKCSSNEVIKNNNSNI